ncbi:poly-gamma-glutamate synthase PgsB [candidate division KSB1 bacterium]|nr:MAG: poly-gamma-glutamate synthase PgsB [candidate division KSB1 bacterium]
MVFLILFALAVAVAAVAEYVAHQRRAVTIPNRIHVNGTRGKSSVTRLIAAGLRAGGIPTMAKTTGTLPRIIDMQGLEVPIIRPGRTNIIEQVKVFRYFARRNPRAIVIECMAVNPEYQWICEHKFVHSTVSVITNCRLDHILEMGPTIENVTRSLCNTLPKNGIAFTSEDRMFWLMRRQARKANCTLYQADPDSVSYLELGRFDHIEHADNVALALAVCEHCGVPRDVALEGMISCHPDAGALRVYEVSEGEKVIQFVHAMAANDPESTLAIWKKMKTLTTDLGTVFVLLNTRADRYDRTIQLLEMIQEGMSHDFSYLFLMGESVERVYSSLPRYGISQDRAVKMGMVPPERTFHEVFLRAENIGTVFAIGNVGKGGLDIARYFASQKRVRESASNPAKN